MGIAKVGHHHKTCPNIKLLEPPLSILYSHIQSLKSESKW